MAVLSIGNFGEVYYRDETSEITWTPQGEPTMVGTPNLGLLTSRLHEFYLMTGTILLPKGPAVFPRPKVEPIDDESMRKLA